MQDVMYRDPTWRNKTPRISTAAWALPHATQSARLVYEQVPDTPSACTLWETGMAHAMDLTGSSAMQQLLC